MSGSEDPLAAQPDPGQQVVMLMFAAPEAVKLGDARVLQAEAAVSRTLHSTKMAEPLGFESSDDGPLMFRYRVSVGHEPQVVRAVVEATCALLDVPHTVGLEEEDATVPSLVMEVALDLDDDPRCDRDRDWQPTPYPYDAPPPD